MSIDISTNKNIVIYWFSWIFIICLVNCVRGFPYHISFCPIPHFSKLFLNSQNLTYLRLKYNCLDLWGMWVSFPEIWRTANGRSEFSSYQIKTVFISNNWLSKYFLLLLLVLFPYWKSEKSMDWTFNCPIMLFWILS